MVDFGVNENSAIYYSGNYWNDLDAVQQMLTEKISGGQGTGSWVEHFATKVGRTFSRALILNCGNGWVERELVSRGLVAEAVGIDYSESLLAEARTAAEAADLPLRYAQMDVNTAEFPDESFDLVVNYAAAHHIAHIDRVFRQLCRILPEDGWFVAFDYVGPHRNQYRTEAWEEVWRLNEELPAHVRQQLHYPSLREMLRNDPTEAVHSELIIDMLQRYFKVEELTPLGGALAYPLITHNEQLFALTDPAEQAKWVEVILTADQEYADRRPESALFAYFSARPDKASLEQSDLLQRWAEEEDEREQRAGAHGGEYYRRGALATLSTALDAEVEETERLRRQVAELQEELTVIRDNLWYSLMRKAITASPVRRVREHQAVQQWETRRQNRLRR